MRKRKHVIALLLAAAMLTGIFTGCGTTAKKESETVKTSEESKTPASESTVASESEEAPNALNITEPVEISVLTTMMSTSTSEAKDLWWWAYLEHWLAEQGYDVTFKVEASDEVAQQINLRFGSDTLPDLVWGCELSTAQALTYGAEDGMILDWAPYVNEETMPNLYKILTEEYPIEYAGDLCPVDGGYYAIPQLSGRNWTGAAGGHSTVHRVFVNGAWLEKCNLDVPTDLDSFMEMLRAFKELKTESGEDVIPVLSNQSAGFLEKHFWIGQGYYGSGLSDYGYVFAIKDGQIELPCYTEDYRTVIEIMHQLYEEELIHPDYFTMDTATTRGLITNGMAGVICDYTLQQTPVEWMEDMVIVDPFLIGDNDEIAVSVNNTYKPGRLWASAKTEYPELLALIVDYMYSDEGAALYYYGPLQGEDPLEMVDGVYFKEDGTISTKLMDDGTYGAIELYARQYIRPNDNVGLVKGMAGRLAKLAGVELNQENGTFKDVITGQEVEIQNVAAVLDPTTGDGQYRLLCSESAEDIRTSVMLSTSWASSEDATRMADLQTVIVAHVKAESAKFITGLRPLEEIDDFYKELEDLDVVEYIELTREAYAPYMDAIYK